MNEFERHLPGKKDQEIVESVIPEKKEVSLGSFKIRKGMKLFKLEISTGLISEVELKFESSTYKVDSVDLKKRKRVRGESFIKLLNNVAKENKANKRMKLTREDGFIYCTALNKKNATRKFVKMLSSINNQ